jgi:hypothetical protein
MEDRDFERNRRAWDAESDAYQERHGAQLRRRPKAWGVWSLPETEIGLLGTVAGRDVLEYGCGGAMSFAAPEATVPEVARILRPGGILAFSVEHPLHAATCHASYFELGRFVDPQDGIVSRSPLGCRSSRD